MHITPFCSHPVTRELVFHFPGRETSPPDTASRPFPRLLLPPHPRLLGAACPRHPASATLPAPSPQSGQCEPLAAGWPLAGQASHYRDPHQKHCQSPLHVPAGRGEPRGMGSWEEAAGESGVNSSSDQTLLPRPTGPSPAAATAAQDGGCAWESRPTCPLLVVAKRIPELVLGRCRAHREQGLGPETGTPRTASPPLSGCYRKGRSRIPRADIPSLGFLLSMPGSRGFSGQWGQGQEGSSRAEPQGRAGRGYARTGWQQRLA